MSFTLLVTVTVIRLGPTSTIRSLQAMEVEENFNCARQPSERWCCIWASAIFGKGGPGRAAVDPWRRRMRARKKKTLTHTTTLSDPRGVTKKNRIREDRIVWPP